MDNPFEFPATLSICTGIRGLERGVERVIGPLRTIAYVEVEAFIIENLLAGMEAGLLAPAPIWANIKTFPWEQFRGKVGLLMGGYPCQPFSTAGLRKGQDDPRHLWPYIEHGIRTTRPICCFFENVSGHLTLGFEQVAHSLRAMGYAVEAGIFTAEEVGAPHKRARLFIIAILADAKSERSGEAWRFFNRQQKWVAGSGEELADTAGGIRPIAERREGGQSCVGGAAMADGISQGLEEWREQQTRRQRETIERSGYIDRWPAAPGVPQFEWECPRTVESGVGCTVDGYNFREDILRALGNGVVEQTAELAFRTLLEKHFQKQ